MPTSSLPEKVTYIVQGEFTKRPGKGKRILRWRGSTDAVDRDGDLIPIEGWDTDNYLKNPVVLFGHDYHSLPVGRARSITMSDEGMDFDIEFPASTEEAGEHFKFTDSVYRMASNGFLSAASVGFRPLESPEYPEEGDGITRAARVWGKRELLELSIVPVPSNPTALRRSFEAGQLKPEEDVPFLRKVLQDETVQFRNLEWATKVDEIIKAYPQAKDDVEIDNAPGKVDGLDELPDLIKALLRKLGTVEDKIDRALSTIVLATPNHGDPVELSEGSDAEKSLGDLETWLGKQLEMINSR